MLNPFFNILPLKDSNFKIVVAADLSGTLILSTCLDIGSQTNKKSFSLHSLIPLNYPGLGTQSINKCSNCFSVNLIGLFERAVLGEIAILQWSHQESPPKVMYLCHPIPQYYMQPLVKKLLCDQKFDV
jgi:hypothetical protein